MILYGLKTCDTCRKALAALTSAGHDARLRDIRAEPLSEAELERFLAVFGGRLVNRASTTWRGLDETARATPEAALLAAHPALMKRPVTEAGAALYLGWGPEVRAALLT